jgi:nucleotide-binding universal stress UspA family protein
MYEKVITGFDGSPESHDALHLARALAEPDDCSLTVARVV